MNIQQEINTLFPGFSDNSKVWIYQSNHVFTDNEVADVQKKVIDFIYSWEAHGKKLQADGIVLFNRFVILVADENLVNVSGCSIDNSVKFIEQLQQDYKIDFFDRFYSVFSIDNQGLIGMNKNDFKSFISEHNVSINEVNIFNNTVNTLKDLKHYWFVNIRDSWQIRLLSSLAST